MVRGQGETSTSQAGRRKGLGRDQPSVSSLVSSMSMEELRSFCRIPDTISLEVSNGPAVSTIRETNSAVYFTWEQFAAGLRFLVSSLVKQFLNVSRAPLELIHPNVIRILMGCSVLNLLFRLDISLVEICFAYTLKLRTGGRLLMSAHNSKLQFVTWSLILPKLRQRGLSWLGALGMRRPTLSGFPLM